MKDKKPNDLVFHNEDAVARITLWGNILAYTILAFATISFVYDLYSIISSWSQIVAGLPPSLIERIAIFVSKVFMNPLVGLFYFLVLRGLVQLLNIGRDLYYQGTDEPEGETAVSS